MLRNSPYSFLKEIEIEKINEVKNKDKEKEEK